MTRANETAERRRALEVDDRLADAYPDATTALDHSDPYELAVATILSAQCTDARVNQVTPSLFARYPDAAALASADRDELEELIRSTGFYRNKATSLLGMAGAVVARHGGDVPADMDDLTQLPGIGRKTANVILGTAFGIASGVVVDTHVKRLSRRLGFTTATAPDRIEADLTALLPRDRWIGFGHRLILHGRAVCSARRPACDGCQVSDLCPKVGV